MPPEATWISIVRDVGGHGWVCGPAVPGLSLLAGGATGVGGRPGRTGK